MDPATPIRYQSGFGNQFESEALAGALPIGRNSPQQVAHGLFAEQLSGSAFTAPRHANLRTWLYRRRPSVVVGGYTAYEHAHWKTGARDGLTTPPNPLRWHAVPIPTDATLDFVDGMRSVVVNGDADAQAGMAVHLALITASMARRAFVNADAEMLLVPQQGQLTLTTELGRLQVAPGEIALLPRGLAFKVAVDGPTRAYVGENYGVPFRLPELGPIGSNGLANARDFLAPVAALEQDDGTAGGYEIVKKDGGRLWRARQPGTPFNVAAWHGNLVPYKYDTRRFMALGSISFDHPDPSIFTVLTSPSDLPGTANCDFVIFPPRWLVTEDTFRPPWYHRNVMSEFMGLIKGRYDARPSGFQPGGMSLHNSLVPHGPDAQTYKQASQGALVPHKLDDTLAFMFESRWRFHATAYAMNEAPQDVSYRDDWQGLTG